MKNNLPKIALAAVLKPIDDTRMFEKFAQSLCKSYAVHLIGFEAAIPDQVPINIHFYPIFHFNRKSNQRWQASKAYLKTLKQIQPDVLIVHAIELLPAACWYSVQNNIPLCYDVRENYWRNIIYQDHYPSLLKYPLAFAVRLLEWSSRLIVKHYFLAERNYEHEFQFSKGKSTVLENKYKPMALKGKVPNKRLSFVYTGTISPIYGAQEAFVLMEKLVKSGLELTFTMIGKVAHQELGQWLSQQAERCSWFYWKGAATPVPHSEIIQLLIQADFSLLPYQTNKSTENCIPTKLYECLALGVPMIVQHNPLWESICEPYQAAVFINYKKANIQELLVKLKESAFYPNGSVEEAKWEKETGVLLNVISGICDDELPNKKSA